MKKAAVILAVVFSLAVFSCASAKKISGDDFFYDENVNLFKEGVLSNGIPVVIKNVPFEKNAELRAVFAGGASVCPKGKGGIDQLTFDLLSESNSKIKERLARGMYFATSDCRYDYSACGFSCAAEDFFDSLPIFASSLLSPEYSHDDYLKKESSAASGAISRSENPRHDLLDAVQKTIYQGSPYLEGIYYKPSSRVSEYDIEKNLASLLNASRMTIIAAGNFSYKEKVEKGAKRVKKNERELFEERAQKLLDDLETLFGGVQSKEWSAPAVPALKFKGKAKQEERSEFAGADFYGALCLACPSRGDEDYEAFALCSLALDSTLSRELVEGQKIAAYCGTAVLNAKKSAALILAGGKKSARDFHEALDEALKTFPTEYDLAGSLDFYKNIYVSRVIGASHNASATLDQIASGIFYQGDAKSFIERPKKIRAVTAQAVRGAFEKYFLAEDSLFVLLTN